MLEEICKDFAISSMKRDIQALEPKVFFCSRVFSIPRISLLEVHAPVLLWPYSLPWRISVTLAQMHKSFTIQVLGSLQTLSVFSFHLYILKLCTNCIYVLKVW